MASNQFSDEFIIETIKLYIGGMGLAEVAEKQGTTTDSVRSWVRKAGFEIRPMVSRKRDWDKIKDMLKND